MKRLTLQDRGKLIRAQIEDPPPGETPMHVMLRHFWGEVDPAPFVDGMHLHAKCEALHSVLAGDITDLVINEPPGSGKTMVLSVFFPAYVWLVHDPTYRMLFASYSKSLGVDNSLKFIELLKAPVVQAAFPEFRLGGEREKKAAGNFTNAHKGLRFTATIPEGELTGKHFDVHTYDDPIKPESILAGVGGEFQTALNKANRWFSQTAGSRFKPGIDGKRILMMQRLHESDPAGKALESGGWEHLCLPEEYVKNAPWIVGGLSAKLDKRTEEGQLLWPELRGPATVERNKKKMGTAQVCEAQLQQNPTPDAGGIVEKKPILSHAYRVQPPLDKCRLVASFDFAFKKKEGGSRVAGHLWAQYQGKHYLIDAAAGHMTYREGKDFVRAKQALDSWKKATFLIENKANGTALEEDLREEFKNLKLYEPGNTPKIERMLPFIEPIHRGEVLFPHPSVFPWAEEVIDEIVKVPFGTHDEHWDCTTQALLYMQSNVPNYSAGLKKLREMGLY